MQVLVDHHVIVSIDATKIHASMVEYACQP